MSADGHGDRSRSPSRLQHRPHERRGHEFPERGRHDEALHFAGGRTGDFVGGGDLRGSRFHQGLSGGEILPRCQDWQDLRGHLQHAARDDCQDRLGVIRPGDPKVRLSSGLSLKCEVLRPSELAKSSFVSQYVQPLARSRAREVSRFTLNLHPSNDLREFSPVVNDLHRNVCEVPRKMGSEEAGMHVELVVPPTTKAKSNSNSKMFPVLVFLLTACYGIMALVVIEQGHVIQSQRNLIQQLFQDSQQLAGLKTQVAAQQAIDKKRAKTGTGSTQEKTGTSS